MSECCAVIITYNPDLSILDKTILSTTAQVDRVYVIDNGSKFSFKEFLSKYERVEGLFLEKNLGIASGFNAGIQRARNAGYRYLLLLDQDSVPPENMVSRYSSVMEALREKNRPVAGIGPRYFDPRTEHTSRFVRFNWFRNSYHGKTEDSQVVPTDFLISSGSFYDLTVFEIVGLFDGGFFIDHVDTEWAHRAKSLGFQLYGVWDVTMEHCLGEKGIRLWILRWRVQPIHKPFRLYYIVRNSLLMYRMPHTPLKWISSDILRLCRLLLMYMIFSSWRREAIRWIARGIRDGIVGVRGPSPYTDSSQA